MINTISLLSTLIFSMLVLIILLFLLPKRIKSLNRFTIFGFVLVFIMGYIMYMALNVLAISDIVSTNPLTYAYTAFASLFESMAMFFLNNTYAVFEKAIPSDTMHFELYRLLFWFIHFAAAAVTATTAVSLVGRKLLSRTMLRLNFFRPIYIICGVTAQSIVFGTDITKTKKAGLVVFIDDSASATQVDEIYKTGALYLDVSATDLKALYLAGIRRLKQIYLFAMTRDEVTNFRIFSNTLNVLKQRRRSCEKVMLFVQSNTNDIRDSVDHLSRDTEESSNMPGCRVFNEAELAVRKLFTEHPPYETITFDENGVATKDIKVLIVGFGMIGQTALRKSYVECQFVNCCYRAVVLDENPKTWTFSAKYPQFPKYTRVIKKCNVYDADFEHEIRKNLDADYIVVALGDDQRNLEDRKSVV
jgi:hypothetical protein